MRHRKNSKSKGGKWVLTYTKDELKHKDFHLDKMIADRQKKISDFKIEQIKLEEKLALLRTGVSEEIIEIEKKIRNIEWVKPRQLKEEIDSLKWFKENLGKDDKAD